MVTVAKPLGYTLGSAFAILALLSPRSQKARFYLNLVLYVGSLGVCSIYGVIVSILMGLVGQRLNVNYVVARSFYLLAGTLTGVRFSVSGEENFAKARPAVLVGNHQTGMDILYLGRIFPKMASIMAKQELKFAPLLGQYMLFSGAVFIDRKNRHDAVKSFNQVGDAMKRKKLSLWIFPEGTRSKLPVPDLLPFKKGAFHLAVQAQVPLVPVVCENYHRLFDNRSRFEGGTIRIKVLEPIETKGLGKDDVNELTEKVRKAMLTALVEMDRERESFDISTASSSAAGERPSRVDPSASSVPANLAQGEMGLGGVAGLMAKIVGTGKGKDYVKRAQRQEDELRKKGTSGQQPDDYGLVSEAERAGRSTAVGDSAGAGSQQRRPAASQDDVEESGVLVEAPQTK